MLDEDVTLRGNTRVIRPNTSEVMHGEIRTERARELEDDAKLTIAKLNSRINSLEEELAYAQRRVAELKQELADAQTA